MASYLSGLPIGAFLIVLNLPFLILSGFDESALTTIVDMEVEGKRFRKRAIH